MINEDYCSFEVVKLLKEKGFDGLCYCHEFTDYEGNSTTYHTEYPENWNQSEPCVSIPTLGMVMKWLLEKDIHVCPKYCCFCGSKKKDVPYFLWEPRILRLSTNNIIYPQPLDMCKHYNSYEKAVEAALKYSLENLI